MPSQMLHSGVQESPGYLSYDEAVIITLTPALFFLINGLVILILKTLQAPINAYPILLFAILGLMGAWLLRSFKMKRYTEGRLSKRIRKYLPVIIAPLFFALGHSFIFGTSYGGDTASYFTNPIYTFFESGQFSHSEKPFIEFGEQPLAVYWLPANSEYIFTGLGKWLGLDYHHILACMHITSNYLIGLAILSIALRFLSLSQAVVISLCLIALIYGLLSDRRDFTATSVFRGFENKGFIWGYFFWTTANLLIPSGRRNKESLHLTGWRLFSAGSVFGLAAFLVSGNAMNLLFPAFALCLGAFLSRELRTIYSFAGFALALIGCAAVFKMLEVTDIYSVVTEELAYREPESYALQSQYFSYPLWVWGLCIGAGLALIGLRNKITLQIGAFLGIALLFRTEPYFNFFFNSSQEFALVFWRHVTLMSPFVPLFFAACLILSSLKTTLHKWAALGGTLVACLLGFVTSALTFPDKSPFGQAAERPAYEALAQLCPDDSRILANVRIATHLPTLQPGYEYLVGKEVFINWQIANLPIGSETRDRAMAVRGAYYFMRRDRVTNAYRSDATSFEKTIRDENPDAIFLPKSRLRDINLNLFSGYTQQAYENIIVFSKSPCRTDFDKIVHGVLDLEAENE